MSYIFDIFGDKDTELKQKLVKTRIFRIGCYLALVSKIHTSFYFHIGTYVHNITYVDPARRKRK